MSLVILGRADFLDPVLGCIIMQFFLEFKTIFCQNKTDLQSLDFWFNFWGAAYNFRLYITTLQPFEGLLQFWDTLSSATLLFRYDYLQFYYLKKFSVLNPPS